MRVRAEWDDYFISIAKLVATRATCDRLHVGCVFVKDKRIIATGYNGAPPGELHCDDCGHLMIDGHCHRTVHAEANAIAQCAANGINTEGAVCYLTHTPCYTCAKLLASAKIKTVFVENKYASDECQKDILTIIYLEGKNESSRSNVVDICTDSWYRRWINTIIRFIKPK